MKIKNIFLKVLTWLYKKQDKINRGITIGIVMAAAVLIIYGVIQILDSDRRRAAAAEGLKEVSPIEADRKRDYGEAGFREVAENDSFILYADLSSGAVGIEEKASGKIWYSNPLDYEEDEIAVSRAKLRSQLTITCLDIENKTTSTYESYSGSIQMGGMEYEFIENGIKFCFSFPAPGIRIPVQYSINQNGFTAEIVIEEVEELWSERYVLTTIDLLPLFGAGGLQEEGYLLVPDGSGAIIEFNNEKQRYMQYQDSVYGRNLMFQETSTSRKQSIAMPVFGMKSGDHAFLAVITSGESSSKVFASTSRKTDSYNKVYSQAVYRQYSVSKISNSSGADWSEPLLQDCNYAVQYFFLDQERADYSGMSQVYREYLLSQGKLHKSELTDKKYLILDLYGAVSIKKYVMGVKVPVITALTTYEDVCEIVSELKARGVENLIINYIGALEGGLAGKMADEFAAESALGTEKEFQRMVDFLKEENVLLFFDTNPVYLYEDGNGYTTKQDSVRTLFDGFAFQYKYSLNQQNAIEDSRWYLLQPQLVPGLMRKFTQSSLENGLKNLSISGLGEYLYPDFSEKNLLSGTQTQELWNQALKETADSTDYLMVHGGNAYCFPYVDIITDIAGSDSAYDMSNQSIPFYQMVLHGNIVMGTLAINEQPDYHYAFLKAVETGSSLKYDWIYTDVTELIGTEYNDMVSASFEYWLDTAAEEYHMLQDAAGGLAGQLITGYEQLEDHVKLVTYESGKSVIVNYNQNEYQYQDYIIEGRGYLIIEGGSK